MGVPTSSSHHGWPWPSIETYWHQTCFCFICSGFPCLKTSPKKNTGHQVSSRPLPALHLVACQRAGGCFEVAKWSRASHQGVFFRRFFSGFPRDSRGFVDKMDDNNLWFDQHFEVQQQKKGIFAAQKYRFLQWSTSEYNSNPVYWQQMATTTGPDLSRENGPGVFEL